MLTVLSCLTLLHPSCCRTVIIFSTYAKVCIFSGWAVQTAPSCVETWRRSSPSSRDYVWLWRTVPSKPCWTQTSMKTFSSLISYIQLLLQQSHWRAMLVPRCMPPCACSVRRNQMPSDDCSSFHLCFTVHLLHCTHATHYCQMSRNAYHTWFIFLQWKNSLKTAAQYVFPQSYYLCTHCWGNSDIQNYWKQMVALGERKCAHTS